MWANPRVLPADARGPHALSLIDYFCPPLPCPAQHHERHSTAPERRHQQPAVGVGGIGLLVASAAQGDELIEVQVRAARGPLVDMECPADEQHPLDCSLYFDYSSC